MSYTAYTLTANSRDKLLDKFPPKYSRVICHHITEQFGVPKNTPIPSIPKSVKVVGYFDSGDGVEGLIVSINGKTSRPDGNTYHITLSINEDRKPVESNNYTSKSKPVSPITIMVTPKVLD